MALKGGASSAPWRSSSRWRASTPQPIGAVVHAQIAGVSYKNLGDAGVQFLSEWADEGARVRVPTTLNPMGMERDKWQQWGISTDFAVPQLSVIDAFEDGRDADHELHPIFVPGAHAQARRCPGLGRVQRGGVR